MRTRSLVVLSLLPAASLAQSNPFIVFPQDPERTTITASSYVRRPDWNRQGEGFQQVTQDLFRGVGDIGGVLLANGFYHWAADLNVATAETYGIILRLADPTGAPDLTPAGIIVQVPNLSLPTNPAGGNQGWIMTDLFATPVVLPTGGGWFQGLDLPNRPEWPSGLGGGPADGGSIWSADTLSAGTPATVGENARIGATPVTWTQTATGNVFRTQWTYIMGTLVGNPVLHIGGIDPLSTRTGGPPGEPSYGMAGLFPDISGTPRSDGINLRLQDNQFGGGIALFAASPFWWAGGPLSVPGFTGDLQLDISTLLLVGIALPTNNAAVLPVVAPGAFSPAFLGTEFMFQGVVFDPVTGTGKFSNGQVTQL
jgi:hypothetical protein